MRPESLHAGQVEVIVAKQRNGPTGTVTLAAQTHFMPVSGYGRMNRAKGCAAQRKRQRCCGATVVYLIWLEKCAACHHFVDEQACLGHGVCVKHAAEVRAGRSKSTLDGAPMKVQRMRTAASEETP